MKSETKQVLKLYFMVEYGLSPDKLLFKNSSLLLNGSKGERELPYTYLKEETATAFKFKADTLTSGWQLLFTKTDIFVFDGKILKDFLRDNKNFVKHCGDLWQINRRFIPTNILNSITTQ